MTTNYDEKRREYADSPGMLALIDRDEFVDAHKPTTIPPCPSWCRYVEEAPDGALNRLHEYDSVDEWEVEDGMMFSRFHVSAWTSPVPYIAQQEFNRGGVVTFGPLHISGIERNEEEMTSEAVRQFAAELLAAADRLDAVTAASS